MSQQTAWDNDLLERKDEGEFLETYLINQYQANKNASFVLNINAEWGFGKTYFLKNIAIDLENKNHPVVYFDAWKNDFTDNPLLAFMSELNTSLDSYFNSSPVAKGFFEDAYKTSKSILLPILIKKFTGYGADEINEFAQDEVGSVEDGAEELIDDEIENGISSILTKAAESALTEHKNVQTSIDTFKKQMEKVLKHIDKKLSSKNMPMFILIDELDRCRPNYAIELLENIKHIFDIPGIVFIVATDSQQLSHSVNAIYGNNFSSERYLKRFFHQEYNLAKPNNYAYANYLFNNFGLLSSQKLFSPLDGGLYQNVNLIIELFCGFAAYFKLGYRDQEQIVIMLNSIVLNWTSQKKIHLAYLLFLIMLKQKDNQSFLKLNETPLESRATFIDDDFLLNLDVDKTIAFKDINDYQVRLEEISKEAHSIAKVYLNFLGITYGEIQERYQSNSGIDRIERSIVKQIYSYYNGGYPDISIKVTEDLDIYPELVLRAGQFS